MSKRKDFANCKTAAELQTDLSRWRLNVDSGCHTWVYLSEDEAKERPLALLEKYWLGFETEVPKLPKAATPKQAAQNGWAFYKRLQAESGHWAGTYDGSTFVGGGVIIASYIAGITLDENTKKEMCRYLLNKADKEDGGWGINTEARSTVFSTTMNYIVLRILGMQPDHPAMAKARSTIHKLGSACAITTWGKFWLCALGVYEWEGMNPIPPEPLLLPSFLPLNPGKWWVYIRSVFVGMCYTYGRRATFPLNDFTRSLREELYDQPYDQIDWRAQRNNVSAADRHAPNTPLLRAFNAALGIYEQWKLPFVRQRALDEALFQIEQEIANTNYLCICAVNFATNLLAVYHAHGVDSHWFKGMRSRIAGYYWMCPEGLASCGMIGGQLWDTAFTVQAVVDAGLAELEENRESMLKALQFLESAQIRENPENMERTYRQPTKGAWPFCIRDQAYAVSDTTAEGLKAAVLLQQIESMPKLVSDERLKDAVDILLGMQNKTGGFGSYERARGPRFLEYLNASEMFGGVMVEYDYPECTTSAVLALTSFSKAHPDYRRQDIKRCIDGATKYILKAQREDGSWYGTWGICFTYAAMFALQGLASVGMRCENSWECRRACAFLLDHQNPDGGWSESIESGGLEKWIPHPEGSQVVNTAFALLALMAARCSNRDAIERGIALLMKRQQENGEWLQEGMEGVSCHTVGIYYPNYKFIFPIWALSLYTELYGDAPLAE